MQIAWGARVTAMFRGLVIGMCRRLIIPDPSWMMSCMAFETGETFSPSIRNSAGSGAVGLIQFMPATAAALGTSIEALAVMTAENQLTWVEEYFRPYKGRMGNLGDLYMAILYPKAIGKPDDFVLFANNIAYRQNSGLDINHDGTISRREAYAKVAAALDRGLLPGNVFQFPDTQSGGPEV